MKTVLARLAALVLGSAPAAAEDVIATLYRGNGSLPPPYHRSLRAEISADGRVRLRACRGYDDNDVACRTLTGKADPAALKSIEAAARAEGLPERPLAANPNPPVGGGSTSATVVLDGQVLIVPPFPAEADARRAEAVVGAILGAIPAQTMAAANAALAD